MKFLYFLETPIFLALRVFWPCFSVGKSTLSSVNSCTVLHIIARPIGEFSFAIP